METLTDRFDRQLRLDEIFSARELENIARALSRLLACAVEIVAASEPEKSGCRRVEILWDLEPIAYLQSPDATVDQLSQCVALFQVLLKRAVQYRMASELHIETVLSDFAALQEKHGELKHSERKFRELSRELEKKVAEQVKEIEAAQRKVYQAEKLASVGQLAAGVAHELNSPLAYIQINLTAAKEYMDDLDPFFTSVLDEGNTQTSRPAWEKEDIDYIRKDFPLLLDSCLDGVKRLSSIVSDLKVFSNINQQHKFFDDINSRLQTVLKLLKPQIGRDIEMVLEFGELPSIPCYPAHLGQVFYNLLQNAVLAIADKGRITVATYMEYDHVVVAVSDTGVGISPADLQRIFDPFFTTREVGKGTGLGLSVIHDVIAAHHGRIEVQSEPGKGSTFTVFLPKSTKSTNEDGEAEGPHYDCC